MAASRVMLPPTAVACPGTQGVAPDCWQVQAGLRHRPRRRLRLLCCWACWVADAGSVAACSLLVQLRHADKILPADDHEHRAHSIASSMFFWSLIMSSGSQLQGFGDASPSGSTLCGDAAQLRADNPRSMRKSPQITRLAARRAHKSWPGRNASPGIQSHDLAQTTTNPVAFEPRSADLSSRNGKADLGLAPDLACHAPVEQR